MRKKRLRLFLPVFILLLCLCGCAEKAQTPLPQLVIGCGNFEPYNYTDEDGEPAGLDVELAREACRRMGYEAVFEQIDWSERDTLLASRQVDCLWSCYAMDGQEDKYAWVGPYMRSRQVVAVLTDSPIQTLADLAGKNIAVCAGTKAETLFLQQADANISNVETVYSLDAMDEVSTALRNYYVDASAGYAAALREALQNDSITYRFLTEDLSRASLGVAFSKDCETNAEICERLSVALDEMLSDGTTAQILGHYGVDTVKALGGLSDA